MNKRDWMMFFAHVIQEHMFRKKTLGEDCKEGYLELSIYICLLDPTPLFS